MPLKRGLPSIDNSIDISELISLVAELTGYAMRHGVTFEAFKALLADY